MDILFLLIPVSVLLVFVIGVVFWWSIRQGQFEDLEGPAYRILMDDDRPQTSINAPEPMPDDDPSPGATPGK